MSLLDEWANSHQNASPEILTAQSSSAPNGYAPETFQILNEGPQGNQADPPIFNLEVVKRSVSR